MAISDEVGQLPLHLAAMNRRTIQEADGSKNTLEDFEQVDILKHQLPVKLAVVGDVTHE